MSLMNWIKKGLIFVPEYEYTMAREMGSKEHIRAILK